MAEARYRYLLDTNAVSALIKDPNGPLTTRLARAGESAVCTSIIVACELRYGAAKKGSAALTAQLERVLAALPVLPLESDVDQQYGELRALLERKGRLIGPHDLLIAAHALTLNLIVVTDNVREFARVPDLKIENWLKP